MTTDFCTLCKRVSRFSVKIVLSHNTKKLRRGTLWCFRKFLVSKTFMLQRVMSRFPVEFFLSHSTEKFRRGILYCCIIFGYRKSLEKRGGRESRFSVEKFLSHSAEKFRRGILYCCINFGYRKSLDKRGEYQEFLSKIFCLTVPKISIGESFIVALISSSEKVYGQEEGGEYQDFPSKTFVSQCRKFP